MDEVTVSDVTQIWELKEGRVVEYQMTPEELGFERSDLAALSADSPGESAAIARSVLGGDKGPHRDVVLVNAAAALLAADRVETFQDGVALAGQSIDSGKAKTVLDALTQLSGTLD